MPRATAGATSSAGSTRPASSTRAGAASPTSRPPGGSRRCSSPARGPLDLARLARPACASPGASQRVEGGSLRFADSLPADCAASDARLAPAARRASTPGSPRPALAAPPDPAAGAAAAAAVERRAGARPRRRGDRHAWSGPPATGRDYRWLRVPVLDADGELRHEGGVTPAPGLYVLGLRFLRRAARASSTASAATPRRSPPRSPPTSPAASPHEGGSHGRPLRRADRRRPRRRRRHRAAARPRRRPRARRRARRPGHRHPLDPRADARRR